jgi:hypothetical protein
MSRRRDEAAKADLLCRKRAARRRGLAIRLSDAVPALEDGCAMKIRRTLALTAAIAVLVGLP